MFFFFFLFSIFYDSFEVETLHLLQKQSEDGKWEIHFLSSLGFFCLSTLKVERKRLNFT